MPLKDKTKTFREWNDSLIALLNECESKEEIERFEQIKLIPFEDAETDKREALEKVAWYCPCCEEWHPLKVTCAVFEIWKTREERCHRWD